MIDCEYVCVCANVMGTDVDWIVSGRAKLVFFRFRFSFIELVARRLKITKLNKQ